MKRQAAGNAPTEGNLQESIKICQEIVRMIRENGPFNVVERISFTGDPRALRMFMDIIKAFAVFRYPIGERAREGRLIATVEYVEDAAERWEELTGISSLK